MEKRRESDEALPPQDRPSMPPSDDDAPEDLITFMQRSPLAEAIAAGEFTLPERSTDIGRDIDLF